MISTSWLKRRREHWTRLEELAAKTARFGGLKNLSRDELREMGLLYRQSAADLAALRTDPSALNFVRYLNQLLARAHNIIYSGRRGDASSALRFFRDYPRVFRANSRLVAIAFGVFLIGALAGAALTLHDPNFQMEVLGPHMVKTIEKKEMWTHSILAMKPVATSGIMTNNISVSFMTFAAGITAGLGTFWMLAFNGVLFGVITTACALAGMGGKLFSFVTPHGVLELPAIFIAGGAGLRIAQALLFPGFLPRKIALSRSGAEAVRLLLGCIPLLVIAGIVEGFVSPTHLPSALKFAVGLSLAALLVVYLLSARDQAPPHIPST